MNVKIIATIRPLTFAVTALFSTSSLQAADLLTLYRTAQTQDAQLASAKAAYQAALERLPQSKAALLPSVSASTGVNYTDSLNRLKTDLSVETRSKPLGLSATLSASQSLYNRANSVAVEQAESLVSQAELVYKQAEQDLITRVAQVYFDILFAEDNVVFIGAQKAAVSEQLAQAKRNFEVGTATITDTNEAQAKYDQVAATEIAALNDLEAKKRALQAIVGTFEPKLSPLSPQFKIPNPTPDSMDAWVSQAENNNFAIRISQKLMAIANLEIAKTRAGHQPTVSLNGSVSANSVHDMGPPPDSRGRQASIGIQVNIPLYTGGLVDSKVREALANQEKARNDLEFNKRIAQLNVRQSFLGVTSNSAQIKAFDQALKSAEIALQSSKLGQEVGVRTNVDVLNSQQTVFQVKRDLAKAKYDYLISLIKLNQAAGSLDDSLLTTVNQQLGQ